MFDIQVGFICNRSSYNQTYFIFRSNRNEPEHSDSQLWNGMLAPLTGMTIKGAIWYQGRLTDFRSDNTKTQ